MTEKAVLITGGAKRVGAAMSRYFATQGYDVALHYNRSKKDALALQKEILAMGVACELFQHDLSDIKGFKDLIMQVQKAMPHCRALVNNASIFERASLMETDETLFDRQFSINLKAPFFLTQAFAKRFGRGCVVNILDTNIVRTDGSHFAYILSKKALAEFTTMAARELGPNIRVNAVCPGIVLPSNELDEQYMKKLSKSLPLGKLANLEQVSSAAYWLCENESVTGQLMFTDGGQHLL